LRMLWVFPSARIAWRIRRIHIPDEPPPPARGVFLIGWTGMRGVIALAAALSLPLNIPHRNLIVFLTFCVIVVTLVVQGLTLPAMIRLLGVKASEERDGEEFEARRTMIETALRRLEEIRDRDAEKFADVYDDVAQHYRTRLNTLTGEGADEHGSTAEHTRRYEEVTRELLRLERDTAVELRNKGSISDDVLRRVLNELDLTETRIDS